MVTWLLSLIGGQGSLRQMSIVDASTEEPISLTYMVPDGNTTISPKDGYWTSHVTKNAIFIASLLDSVDAKASTVDFWNNIKVPIIEYHEEISRKFDEGWYTFEPQSLPQHNYPSLLGIPMSDMDTAPAVDYITTFDTMYFRLNCTTRAFENHFKRVGASGVCPGTSDTPASCIWWTEDIINGTTDRTSPFELRYSANIFTEFVMIGCAITTTYVEVEVWCPKLLPCQTTRIRRSTLPQPPAESTLFDLINTWNHFIGLFTQSVQIDGSSALSVYPSLLDTYLAFPNNPGLVGVENLTLPEHNDESYAIALGQLINTYWSIWNAPLAITGGIKNDTAYLSSNKTFLSTGGPGIGSKSRTWPTQSTKMTYSRMIRAHKDWVAALAISSAVLVLAGIVPPLLRVYQRGPDIMINISGLVTRNNPHVPLASQGSWMDAGERVRLLGDVKVRFGDFDSTSDVGNLAIGGVAGGMGMVSRARKGRMYD